MGRLEVAAALVNSHLDDPGVSRPSEIFLDHGYSAPASKHDWEAIARTARDITTLLTLVADRDHDRAIAELNDQLAGHHVTLQLEPRRERRSLHFHAAEASFAQGWAAGITAAIAIAYSAGEAERIGRCEASTCKNFFVDRGRNKKRRFCSLRCQNRTKSAVYRERVTRGERVHDSVTQSGRDSEGARQS